MGLLYHAKLDFVARPKVCDQDTSHACVDFFETIGVYKVSGSSACEAASCYYKCRDVETACVEDSSCRECLSSWNADQANLRDCVAGLQAMPSMTSFALFSGYARCVADCDIVQPSVVSHGTGSRLPTSSANILDPQDCAGLRVLSFGRGLLSSLLILLCLTIQSQVYNDPAFKFVQKFVKSE